MPATNARKTAADGTGAAHPDMARLSSEERRSLTHGEFWIPEAERNVYRLALETLNNAGVPYVVSGLYAIYEYTGIYRKTKDLDLMLEPDQVVAGARALREAGFRTVLHEPHWIAKAFRHGHMIDLVYGMGNGLHFIDKAWLENSRPAILAATPVRIAPPEDLIWHRLFISERHRTDMADVVHLIVTRGDELDWQRLLERTGEHWRLLLAQIHLFDYVYPAHHPRIPDWVREELLARAQHAVAVDAETEAGARSPSDGGGDGAREALPGERDFRGTLVSRFSFAIDVNEWGFRDPRAHAVAAARACPVVAAIRDSDVWQNKEAVHGGRHPEGKDDGVG